MLNKKKIGAHAGIIWSILNNGNKWNYRDLQRKVALEIHEFNAALGWLAHEDKIEFEEKENDVFIFTRDYQFHFYF